MNEFTSHDIILPSIDEILAKLQENKLQLHSLKPLIAENTQQLIKAFNDGYDIALLIELRAQFFDHLLTARWRSIPWEQADCTQLIAVGGYGRYELHPYSDIDILLLVNDDISDKDKTHIEHFVTALWDLNVNIGHSVRTLEECLNIAREDVTVITNLIESRLLCGSSTVFSTLKAAIHTKHMWPSENFFIAKREEQIQRHKLYNDTEYNLEPNIKACPGGLRDIQMVSWFLNRHTNASSVEELVTKGYLNTQELNTLIQGKHFMWRVRFALHAMYGRDENRLLFEAQTHIAKQFNFRDNGHKLAVEQFMQEYYRWALMLTEINDMLMQLFEENILSKNAAQEIELLDDNFQLVNKFIDIRRPNVFRENPSRLLEIFALSAEHSRIIGFRANTIRAIRQNVDLIDDEFRANPDNHQLFMRLLRAPKRIGSTLKLMNRFGVLGKYIPVFGKIMGQTQHDLFHIYTVDAHTLLVVQNIRKACTQEGADEWPIMHQILQRIDKVELLYLAALFHDIAKGRGGDHSTLGAVDALEFCKLHGLSRRDCNLVSWLVKKHLIMSSTAQRKDIADPEIIRDFALEVGDLVHLDYLYVLTVADITATNKKLWNAWRASLIRQLYSASKRALRRGLEHYLDREEWIAEQQQQAMVHLNNKGYNPEYVLQIWNEPNNDFFLREKVIDIVWRTEQIMQHLNSPAHDESLILFKQASLETNDLAAEIFFYMPAHPKRFAIITAALEQLDLSIQDVRIYTTQKGHTLDSYYVLDINNTAITLSSERANQIIKTLRAELDSHNQLNKIIERHTPRQLKYFSLPTQTQMTYDDLKQCHVLEVTSPDRPGLLARIARIFIDFDIRLINAKIATLGESVEDIFFICESDGSAIFDEQRQQNIQSAIRDVLDKQNKHTA